jgi:hypothetical protein
MGALKAIYTGLPFRILDWRKRFKAPAAEGSTAKAASRNSFFSSGIYFSRHCVA